MGRSQHQEKKGLPAAELNGSEMFKEYEGPWTDLRKLLVPAPREIDYHPESNQHDGLDFWRRMDNAYKDTLEILKQAQEDCDTYVMFLHGSSTSRPGATTFRSQIRKLMRSKEATPYIIRKECIQHRSVFVARIRHKFEVYGGTGNGRLQSQAAQTQTRSQSDFPMRCHSGRCGTTA